MNRPDKNDYLKDTYSYKTPCSKDEYIKDLECYCDNLEERHRILVQYSDDLLSDNKELTQALDKACYELDLSNKQLMNLDSRFIRMTSEHWKEYLLCNAINDN